MKDKDELRNIDVGQETVVVYKNKSGFFGKLVALLLGLIFGIAATVGGVAIFGWFTYTKAPIANSIDTVNGLLGTNIDYTQYINGSYGEKTLKDLVGDTITAVDKVSKGEGTLNTLNEISPLVGKTVVGDGTEGNTGLVGMLANYAIIADPEAVMNRIIVKPAGTPDSPDNKDVYLTDYLKDRIDNAYMGDIIQAFGYEMNDVIKTICYGAEGIDYYVDEKGEIQMIHPEKKITLSQFLGDGLDEQIKLLPLDAFIAISFPSDTVMCMLAYGAEYRYEKTLDANGNVVMKQVFYEGAGDPFALTDDEGNDVTANIVSGADNPQNGIVLNHIVTQGEETITKTRYLQYNATDGRYYAFEEATYETPILFEKNTVGMLSDGTDKLIGGIYVKDLLNVTASSERVMIALCYGKEGVDWQFNADKTAIDMIGDSKPRTVNDLKNGNVFDTLTLQDLLGDDVNSNPILLKLADKTFSQLPTAMEELTFADIFADKIYTDDTHTTIQPMWKYLFDDPNVDGEETPDQYYILGGTSTATANKNGVDKMIENMKANIQTATLAKLVQDDLIVFENDADGSKKQEFLTSTTQTVIGGKYLRDLTIIEVINWAINPTGSL